MTRLIDYRCISCGSTEITFDASAEWDAGQQEFVVSSTYDACFCNSEACQGEECRVAEFDARTGEALGLGPGSFEYIPKDQADAEWAKYHEDRKAERRHEHPPVRQAHQVEAGQQGEGSVGHPGEDRRPADMQDRTERQDQRADGHRQPPPARADPRVA
ncbi:MAG: hypothetical protein L3J02_02430, partial [Henriciella sp.]|nr:hypothetical protein [Henriciella sp.]